MLENLIAWAKHEFKALHTGFTTGNWDPLIEEIKQNWRTYKLQYILLFFLLAVIFLHDTCIPIQSGGVTPDNAPPPSGGNNAGNAPASNKKNNAKTQKNNAGSQNNADSSGKPSAGGLCSGSGFFSKFCRGAGSGVSLIFKTLGFALLGVVIVLAPAVIYMALVFVVLRMMFLGTRQM